MLNKSIKSLVRDVSVKEIDPKNYRITGIGVGGLQRIREIFCLSAVFIDISAFLSNISAIFEFYQRIRSIYQRFFKKT